MNRAAATPAPTADLYPPAAPDQSGYLEADGGHRIYWETCGNPGGRPALFVHGGPGGGCSATDRRFFDPARYRIVLFDQRGCGRSRPHASLAANTTALLVADMETLRQELGIDHWLLLGGSWGAALALAYAQTWPERVSSMVMRGVFTGRQSELDWLYREGASFLYPDAWERFVAPVPQHERGNMIAAYYARLTCGDAATELAAARAWCAWEDELMPRRTQNVAGREDDASVLARARIETHFFVNGSFMAEGQLISNVPRLKGIPAVIVQGRCDAITPARTAWDLHKAWSGSELKMIPGAGHASVEPGIAAALIGATDRFAS